MSVYKELWHEFALRTRKEHPYHHTTTPSWCPECDSEEDKGNF